MKRIHVLAFLELYKTNKMLILIQEAEEVLILNTLIKDNIWILYLVLAFINKI